MLSKPLKNGSSIEKYVLNERLLWPQTYTSTPPYCIWNLLRISVNIMTDIKIYDQSNDPNYQDAILLSTSQWFPCFHYRRCELQCRGAARAAESCQWKSSEAKPDLRFQGPMHVRALPALNYILIITWSYNSIFWLWIYGSYTYSLLILILFFVVLLRTFDSLVKRLFLPFSLSNNSIEAVRSLVTNHTACRPRILLQLDLTV